MRLKKPKKLRWWQVRTSDFALFLYVVIIQRWLMVSIWFVGATYADTEDASLSRFFDSPIAGNHPKKMVMAILVLLGIYYITCFITAIIDKCYHWLKFILIFLPILAMFVLTGNIFRILFIIP